MSFFLFVSVCGTIYRCFSYYENQIDQLSYPYDYLIYWKSSIQIIFVQISLL